eukprot:5012071-Prymnesium_polylepis.1
MLNVGLADLDAARCHGLQQRGQLGRLQRVGPVRVKDLEHAVEKFLLLAVVEVAHNGGAHVVPWDGRVGATGDRRRVVSYLGRFHTQLFSIEPVVLVDVELLHPALKLRLDCVLSLPAPRLHPSPLVLDSAVSAVSGGRHARRRTNGDERSINRSAQ